MIVAGNCFSTSAAAYAVVVITVWDPAGPALVDTGPTVRGSAESLKSNLMVRLSVMFSAVVTGEPKTLSLRTCVGLGPTNVVPYVALPSVQLATISRGEVDSEMAVM